MITRSPSNSSHPVRRGLSIKTSRHATEADDTLLVPLPKSDRTLAKKLSDDTDAKRKTPILSGRSPHLSILSGFDLEVAVLAECVLFFTWVSLVVDLYFLHATMMFADEARRTDLSSATACKHYQADHAYDCEPLHRPSSSRRSRTYSDSSSSGSEANHSSLIR